MVVGARKGMKGRRGTKLGKEAGNMEGNGEEGSGEGKGREGNRGSTYSDRNAEYPHIVLRDAIKAIRVPELHEGVIARL